MNGDICTACGKKVPPGMRFCTYCGKQLPDWKCPVCGAVNRADNRFCQQCNKEKTTCAADVPLRRCSCGDMTFSQRVFCRSCGGLLQTIPPEEPVNFYRDFRMQKGTTKSEKYTLSLYVDHMSVTFPGLTVSTGIATPPLSKTISYADMTALSIETKLPVGTVLKVLLTDGETLQFLPPWNWRKAQLQEVMDRIQFLKARRENYRTV